MPSSDHETTLARQWEILRNHLPSRSPWRTSRDLRERLQTAGHNVSKRTIERDMEELSRIFPVGRNEVSIPYGWHWKSRIELNTESDKLPGRCQGKEDGVEITRRGGAV